MLRSSLPRRMASMARRRLLSRHNHNTNRELAPIPQVSSALVDFQTSAKIEGEETQVATITLQPGQTIRAESGSLVFMTSSIQLETSSSMSDGMKRFMTGQSLFVTDFTAKDSPGQVALAPAFPSKVLQLNLQEYGGELVCQKGAYVASNVGVSIDMAYAKNFSTGFFGGEGFVLQKLSGEGDVLLQASGALIRRDLSEGETLRVSSGTLVCFTNTIDYDVQMMPGFKNVMFGGEGLFVTTLKGPGTVWMQGMPPNRMISEIARRVPGGGIGFGVPMGMGGGGSSSNSGSGAADEAAAAAAAAASGGETVDGAEGGGGGGGGGSSDEMVAAASDAAMNADRQATVATSGAMGGTMDVDSDSSDSLFGDAVPKDTPSSSSLSSQSTSNDAFGQDTTFGETSQEPSFDDGFDQGGFSEETSFSSEDSLKDFADDNSSFSSYGESSGGDLGDSISGDNVDAGGIMDTAKSVFSTLWDLFNSDD